MTQKKGEADALLAGNSANIRHIILSPSDKAFYAIVYTVTALAALLVIYPLIYILSASFSSGEAVTMGRVVLWPVDFSIDGYIKVFRYPDVFVGYRNTIFYTVAGTAINVFMTLICAYPLARKGLPHKGLIMFLFTFTMMFSGGLIPTYLLVNSLGMVNTPFAMLVPGALAVYQMIITRTFIQSTIPDELLESVKIDGCSDFRFFTQFIIPLSQAVIAVIALQYAVGHWNTYFSAMIYLSSKNLYPLQIFLRQILVMSQFDTQDLFDQETASAIQGMKDLMKYALIVVSTAPILCIYPFLQKYFVRGIMIGSLKG
jgi:multiple sugar transport system permease protein/putative aldouronate transport system permease protein